MKILGIETSCDETSAAVVENGQRLLSNVVATSLDLHAQYGGVVPEIAARSHIEFINPVINQALKEAFPDLPEGSLQKHWQNIDAIAVTYGAGLGGSLLVGVMAARTLAIVHQKALYACNHVMGHVYANFITDTHLKGYRLPSQPPRFPMLALIVSGGHTQLALFRDYFSYTLLGQTHDDAIGEAFDKVAKILGLPYPGGPSISQTAHAGNPNVYSFPKAKTNDKYDFSFSGLKTAVLRRVQAECDKSYEFPSFKLSELLDAAQKADFAASFQHTAVETVIDKTFQAYEEFKPASVVIAGGVAANQELRHQLKARLPLPAHFTDPKLCTDNGAMIAALGGFMAQCRQPLADPYSLNASPNLSM